MSKFELKLPQMGESVAEATLTSWLKDVGDTIDMDEAVFEIATDKVDSEVPSEVEGVLLEKLFDVDDVIAVGQTVAVIEIDGEGGEKTDDTYQNDRRIAEVPEATLTELESNMVAAQESVATAVKASNDHGASTDRFYSPLVKNIAKQEGISLAELDAIAGTGKEGRVTKNDILAYVQNGNASTPVSTMASADVEHEKVSSPLPKTEVTPAQVSKKVQTTEAQLHGDNEIIPMTRMGKLIAQHMVDSVSTSAHVQSFIEVDVTNIVNWRS
ncbi:MAG: biotin/lipoyl-containing protein, partial [Bacteroidota bacterium]